MSGLLLGAATVVLTLSATALGFGIACVADGEGDAGCALLVLGPVIAGFPLGVALAIFGAAQVGWLGRWVSEDEDGSDGVLRQALRLRSGEPQDERIPDAPPGANGRSESVLRQAQDEPDRGGARGLRQAGDERGLGEEELSRSVPFDCAQDRLRQAHDERILDTPHGPDEEDREFAGNEGPTALRPRSCSLDSARDERGSESAVSHG